MFKNVIIICCIAVTLTSCPKPSPRITVRIVNNSNEDILWMCRIESNGEWYEIPSHPWTNKFGEKDYGLSLIKSGIIFEHKLTEAYKDHLKKGWSKYYFFNYDSVETIPWQRICDERIILKEVRIDTWEDFEITYP